MKAAIKNFFRRNWKVFFMIMAGIIAGLSLAIGLSGCAAQEIVVTKKVNIPVKVKLEAATYYKVMTPPIVYTESELTIDNLQKYLVDLQNKYLLMRNVFFNTIEPEFGFKGVK